MTISKAEFTQTVLSALAGWMILLGTLAVLIFSSFHEPDLGFGGAFFIWSLVLSLFYLGDFVVIVALYYLELRPWMRTLSWWMRPIVGSGLFCVSVPLFSMAGAYLRWQDMLFFCGMAAAIGWVCFLVLCRRASPADSL